MNTNLWCPVLIEIPYSAFPPSFQSPHHVFPTFSIIHADFQQLQCQVVLSFIIICFIGNPERSTGRNQKCGTSKHTGIFPVSFAGVLHYLRSWLALFFKFILQSIGNLRNSNFQNKHCVSLLLTFCKCLLLTTLSSPHCFN